MKRFCLAWLLVLPCLFPVAAPAETTPVFLWKVTGATGRAYLLGSMHAAKQEVYPLDDRIERAFAASDTLVVEANIHAADPLKLAATVMTRASYPPGETLADHVSEEVLAQTRQHFRDSGMPASVVEQLKPWFLGTTIVMGKLQELGIAADQGIDLHFLRAATAANKPIIELEGVTAQLDLLSGFPPKEQELFLRYTFSEMDQLETSLDKIVAAWKRGDAAALEELLRVAVTNAPETAPIYKAMFDDRNHKLAAKIEELLQQDKTFYIVVGAGHLVGETGLVELLRRKFKVEQQ